MPARTQLACLLVASACFLTTLTATSMAQQTGAKGGCTDSTTTPPTRIEKGPDSGSKNMGTTGWSGGMREPGAGSPSDKKPGESAEDQPSTAQGLDPTKKSQNKSTSC